MAVSQIKIIKPGTLAIDGFESPESYVLAMKYLSGIGGGSTVSLIKSDATILVDTGYDYETDRSDDNIKKNRKNLLKALKFAGFTPKDIDMVYISHWHADHFMNYKIFSDSEIIVHDKIIERLNLDFTGVAEGEKIADGVEVLFTPGHTIDNTSLLLKTEPLRYMRRTNSGGMIWGIGKVNVVIAGDAIVSSACYATNTIWNHNGDFFSHDAAFESTKKIREVADFIIPGHGGIFTNTKEEKMSDQPS